MIGKRISNIRAVSSIPVGRPIASIAVGTIAGAGVAFPGIIAGLYIALAFLPGPISGEIIMGLLVLGPSSGAIFGLPCGAIGWFSCSAAGLRGWVLSATLALVVAALGAAVLYWLLIAPRATVPEHSVVVAGVALTIGVGISGAVSAVVSRAIGLGWRSNSPEPRDATERRQRV